jgi:hypothetical protein
MNPGLSEAELLTAWHEAGGRLFESIQELIDVKKMIYHGVGERLIEERKRECDREYACLLFPFLLELYFSISCLTLNVLRLDCKNDFERDLRKLGRKLLKQEYKRLSRLHMSAIRVAEWVWILSTLL